MTRPVVAVYRKTWKGWDLTFIQNQVAAYSGWKPFRMVKSADKGTRKIAMDYQLPRKTLWDKRLARLIPINWTMLRFRWHLRTHKVRLIHVHFGIDAAGFLSHYRRCKLPLVVTFHGFDVTKNLDGDSEVCQRNRLRLKSVFEKATLLIAVSKFIADRLRLLGAPESKIRVHYMGIPHRTWPEPREKRGVLFVGRFVEKKGVDDVIRAYAGLPDAVRADHPLLLVGSGGFEPALRELATSLGVEAKWLGWKTSAEVFDLMAEAAVFCGPSKKASHGDSEGLGMVFLEAQSQGTPVVSTRSGGIVDAVIDGKTGLLVDEANVEQLTGALKTLLVDRQRAAAMGQAGAEFVREKFDVVSNTRELEALYDEARTLYSRPGFPGYTGPRKESET